MQVAFTMARHSYNMLCIVVISCRLNDVIGAVCELTHLARLAHYCNCVDTSCDAKLLQQN